MQKKRATFVQAYECVYVYDSGYLTTAWIRGGVCVRSITVNRPDNVTVQTLSGDDMINMLAGRTEQDLQTRGFVRVADRSYYIGPDGREYDRTDDGGYLADVVNDDVIYQVYYDANGNEC